MTTDMTYCNSAIDINNCRNCIQNIDKPETKAFLANKTRIIYAQFSPRESKIQGWHCDYELHKDYR